MSNSVIIVIALALIAFGVWTLFCVAVGAYAGHRAAKGKGPVPTWDEVAQQLFGPDPQGEAAPPIDSEGSKQRFTGWRLSRNRPGAAAHAPAPAPANGQPASRPG
jgi:hypothetical protein